MDDLVHLLYFYNRVWNLFKINGLKSWRKVIVNFMQHHCNFISFAIFLKICLITASNSLYFHKKSKEVFCTWLQQRYAAMNLAVGKKDVLFEADKVLGLVMLPSGHFPHLSACPRNFLWNLGLFVSLWWVFCHPFRDFTYLTIVFRFISMIYKDFFGATRLRWFISICQNEWNEFIQKFFFLVKLWRIVLIFVALIIFLCFSYNS